MSWLLRGLLIGAGIALLGVAIAGTGGLAAAAIIGATAAGGAGLGEVFSTMSWAPKEVCGFIIGACSSNVFTNGIKAARAHVDLVNCFKHSTPHPPIATGSATVFINGFHAARVDDQIACGAVITNGSSNVFIGGGTYQTNPVNPENLVPGWVHAALFIVGGASAIALAGPVIAIGGLIGGAIGGKAGEILGGKAFGDGSDGQKWSMLAGSFLGGIVGAKGAPKTWDVAKRIDVQVSPGTLGMSGGNVKVTLKTYRTKSMDPGYISEDVPGNNAPKWVGATKEILVRYIRTAEEREQYRINFKDGKAYDNSGAPFDSSLGEGGRAIFVMDEHGNFFASTEAHVGEFHHSTFFAGKPVAAAGEIESVEGIITAVSNRSGHYKPGVEYAAQAMSELKARGIDMRYVLREFN
jgi:uncharacterized Zn-binding protein involved in type VI secretion